MNMQMLALGFLAATAVGGLAWVFLYPLLSGEKKAEARRASVSRAEPVARQTGKAQRSSGEQVEATLKEGAAGAARDRQAPTCARGPGGRAAEGSGSPPPEGKKGLPRHPPHPGRTGLVAA